MQDFQAKITQIVEDQTHGSSYILNEITRAFLSFKPSSEELRWSFAQLQTIDPTMVLIHHFIKEMNPLIDHAFQEALMAYLDQWKHVEKDMANNLAAILTSDHKCLTHSHSQTAIKVLHTLAESHVIQNVVQTTSNPGGEGVVQAEHLTRLGVRVRVIADESIEETLNDIDCIILGADQYNEKGFVNKVGSKEIVDLAFKHGRDAYVLCDSRKEVDQLDNKNGLFELVPMQNHVHLIHE